MLGQDNNCNTHVTKMIIKFINPKLNPNTITNLRVRD
jgi:hypothetical protein